MTRVTCLKCGKVYRVYHAGVPLIPQHWTCLECGSDYLKFETVNEGELPDKKEGGE